MVALRFKARDHPRSRGEHETLAMSWVIDQGPSPLARGTLNLPLSEFAAARTIPARAGNTHFHTIAFEFSRDHPRSRGEHPIDYAAGDKTDGPSPLARGTQRRRLVQKDVRGTIPARAGNTAEIATITSSMRDHPRSRGEHDTHVTTPMVAEGPSPLARGTPGVAEWHDP